MTRKVEISHKTIIFIAVFIASLWFLYLIRDIALQFFIALLLMTILNPFIVRLSKFKIPKAISILFSYVLFFGVLGYAIASIIPALVEQTTNLVNSFPRYMQNLGLQNYLNDNINSELIAQLGAIPSQIIKIVFSLFGNVLSILTVAIFAFYLLLQRDKLSESLAYMVGDDRAKGFTKFLDSLEINLGGWARGQFLLMFLIGLSTYIGLLLLGIPYALPLAMFAGVFEIIPYVGPIIAAVPVVILGFSISPFLGLAALGLTILIQQLENYVFVPKIMEKSTGVPPVITLLSLAIGYEFAGIVGMIISVPIVVILQTILIHKYGKN
jgi:predicted PurR-regulated permease PerM